MDSPPEETTSQKAKAAFYIAIGFAIAFGMCLGLGVLDAYGYLDPILDFFGIP
jgi:hypothetical protein